jgi:serine kinase of HPr protein (carbohydrate metabolism regulator)
VDGAPKTDSDIVHATAIAVGGRAALIRGPSGAGKSDLALRCLAWPPSALLPNAAVLVADDRVRLERFGIELRASAPETIRGLMEARGLGIVTVPTTVCATVVLAVDLVDASAVERMPDRAIHVTLLGVQVPLLSIAGFESSAPLKVLLALTGRCNPAGEEKPCVAREPL